MIKPKRIQDWREVFTMKYLPNAITILRLFLIPVFVYVFFSENPYGYFYALAIFLIAGVTDLLDGYLARKYDVVSVVGVVLDPLADKLMLLTALWCLSAVKSIPFWVFVVMIIIEGLQILSGIYLYFKPQEMVIPANRFGKSATLLFTVAVSMLILIPGSPAVSTIVILAVAAKAISFSSYIVQYLRNLRENKEL